MMEDIKLFKKRVESKKKKVRMGEVEKRERGSGTHCQ